MSSFGEWIQVLLDHVASGRLGARDLLMGMSAAGLSSGLSAATVQQALTAGETQTLNQAKAKRAYDYIVIGSGASGSIIVCALSAKVQRLRNTRLLVQKIPIFATDRNYATAGGLK
jgi:hypothetical protein